MGKSSGSPPEPDYTGAAEATAAGDLAAARAAAAANRVNQVTPYGNLTYSNSGRRFDQAGYDRANEAYRTNLAAYRASLNNRPASTKQPAMDEPVAPRYEDFYTGSIDDGWTATQTLSPDQQALLDQQNKTSLGLASLADKGLGYVSNTLSSPFDMSGAPAYQSVYDMSRAPAVDYGDNAWNNAYNALIERDASQRGRADDANRAILANQGITMGSKAYQSSMDDQTRAKNDFLLAAQQQAGQESSRLFQQSLANRQNYAQEQNQAYNQGLLGRQNYMQEKAFLRNEPLNMLNAVRTGSQVTNPSFVSVPQQSTTRGADYLGAAQGQSQYNMGLYNSEVASNNAMTSAGVSAAATVAAAALM